MKVTENDIKVVATLSRLSIREDEKAEVIAQLDKFLTYVENLQAIDTEKIQPTTYALPMQNVFRADEVKKSLDRELALSNAPLKEDGYFKVPRVLEEE
ncbi:MAG: Asp-tRNA(Asn)/Glu-tRNA(Gln) amidotransferase subunit GatC [Selenomonadaceae bacterium]|nr:Asp-tRNA(Asn)/Glu-tRNA(Gln) amidotransferase subunit GatC [Selenomonadaceae bacterium]